MTPPRRPPPPAPRVYGLLLLLAALLGALLLPLDGTIAAYRRVLSEVGLASARGRGDAAREYAHLATDVDASVEEDARKKNDAPDRCARLLLYLPDVFADHGHGSQLNTYLMGALTATYLDRGMVLVEPPLEKSKHAGGSQFGCPVDAFREEKTPAGARWDVKPDFPRGLSRLVRHPAWLSRGCPVPCAETHGYDDWLRLARTPGAEEVTCANSDGTESNVVVLAGGGLRSYFRELEPTMTADLPPPASPQAAKARWAFNLGATPREKWIFGNIQDPRQAWEYAVGLANKAGFPAFQPWIARDVGLFLASSKPFRGEYDAAVHVRRGDKLVKEARGEVVRYWRSQGHADEENLPTDYVPFAHYLAQWDGADKCPVDDRGEVRVVEHNVYVATDDPVTVREEIAALPHHDGADSVLLHGCHRLTFRFNPTDAESFHLNGDGEHGFDPGHAGAEEDSCFARYRRNVVSVADMMLLSRARVFVGEYNSNWGRLIRTTRVRLNGNATQDQMRRSAGLTTTLDTRVAWGSRNVRTPGY